MILVKPSFEVLTKVDGEQMLRDIEAAGRTCYKSEDEITGDSARKFVSEIIRLGHHSVLEHGNISVKIICDRGVTHEIVRHRLCAYSQESTRYCNYGGGVTFVIPPWLLVDPGEYHDMTMVEDSVAPVRTWWSAMLWAEQNYRALLDFGWSPQQARSVLPNSLKTEIVMTVNVREWRHIFTLRTSTAAHPQMREIMIPILSEFVRLMPILFDAI